MFWRKLFKPVGIIVKIFPLSSDVLRDRSFCHSELVSESHYYLEDKKLRRYEDRLFTLTSQSSNRPTLLSSNNHSCGNASLIPPYGLPCNDGTNIPSLEGRGSKGVGESKPSPHPSPTGEGAICHSEALIFKKLKQISNNTVCRVERHAPERIQPMMADGCQEVRMSSNLDGKKIRRYEGKLFTLKSLSSNPPTLLSSNNQPLSLTLSRKGRGKSVSSFTLHPSLKRNAAFTLAEVLITLGIIGVVAALTIPVLIAKYNFKVYETAFKKQYSVFQNAINYASEVNGYSNCYTYFPAGSQSYQFVSSDCQALIASVVDLLKLQKIDGSFIQNYATIAEVLSGGGQSINAACSYDQALILSDSYVSNDGTIFIVGDNGKVVIDINGYKGPNKWGYDVFFMILTKHNLSIVLTDELCSIIEKGGKFPRTILRNQEKNADTNGYYW